MKLKVSWLKGNYQVIQYFGLGFIQIKLNESERVHFYSEKLPPIVNVEDIHDHRYDFTSTILKGTLTNETFHLKPGYKYIMTEESCNPNIKVDSNERPVDVELNTRNFYRAGSSYFLPHTTLHRVSSDNCITYIKRSDYKKDLAHVIFTGEKVCPFSKKISEAELWTIVEDMIYDRS